MIEGKLKCIKSRRRGNDRAILTKTDVEELKRKMGRVNSVEEYAIASGTPKRQIARRAGS